MCQEIRRHTWQAFPVRPIVCNICLRLYLNTFTYDSCLLRITISEDLNFDYLIAIISAQQLIPHTHQAISEQNTINCWGISKSYIYPFICLLLNPSFCPMGQIWASVVRPDGKRAPGLLGAMLSSMQTWGLPTCFSLNKCILYTFQRATHRACIEWTTEAQHENIIKFSTYHITNTSRNVKHWWRNWKIPIEHTNLL